MDGPDVNVTVPVMRVKLNVDSAKDCGGDSLAGPMLRLVAKPGTVTTPASSSTGGGSPLMVNVGGSLMGATLMVAVAFVVLNAVAPPLDDVSARPPSAPVIDRPLVKSQARNVN